MKVEMGKEYTTRDGRAVRIYAVDGGGQFPVHGAVRDSNSTWAAHSWSVAGSWSASHALTDSDLIEAPRKFRLEGWLNVYKDGEFSGVHQSKYSADRAALPSRIACVRVVIECAEGDGLAESKEGG